MRFWLTYFLVISWAFAQSQGRIAGVVEDPREGRVPQAQVVAEDERTGLRRATLSDAQGRYSLPDLPIGVYRVTVQAPGFTPSVRERVELNVASALSLNFRLTLEGTAERVEVREQSVAIEPQQASGVLVERRRLVELPINGRDFARFSLLSAGAVSRSSALSDLTFNGLHPGHNNFTLDGVDVSRGDQPIVSDGFQRGARLLTGSLDSMGEFRIQTANYRAEYGRAAGTVVTVASRSGSNEFHGTLFHFLRNSALDARNYFNVSTQQKDPFTYNNFGGNLGGPVRRNRTFFFANFEGSRQRQGVRGTGTVPSALMRQRALAASPAVGFLLENFPLGTSPTADPLVDSYSRFQSLAIDENTGSARLDHQITEKQRLFARFNLNNSLVDGPLFSILPTALGATDFQFVPSKTRNAVLNYQATLSPRTLVEFTAGMQRTMTNGSSETPFPQVSVTGLTVVPGSRRLNLSNSTVFQYGGTMTHIRGGHTLKAGYTLWRTRVNSWTTSVASLVYLNLEDFIRNSVAQATLTAGTFGNGIRQTHQGVFVQDTWQVRPGLTVDLGLRYDYSTPNHDAQDRLRAFDILSGTLLPGGANWYAPDRNNWAPRLSVAWQLTRRVALRTGYGLFFQQYPPGGGNALAQNTLEGNTQLARQQIPNLSWPLAPFVSRGTTPAPVANGFNYDKPDVYAQQWNFTLVTEAGGGWGVETAYVGNRGLNIRRQVNVNWLIPGTTLRPFPAFSRVNVDFANGQSSYHALQINVRKAMSAGVTSTVSYAFGKVLDNAPDALVGAAEPQDNRCFACERGPGNMDVRHNLSYSVLWDVPWLKRSRWWGGWKLSSLALLRSGAALNVTQPQNTAGSDNLTNQRPDRVAGVDPYAAQQSPTMWLNPAAFQVAPRGRYGNSGRNPLYGPSFMQVDASAIKETRLTEGTSLQFRAEVFNLFNTPNFAAPNTVVGTPNFGRIFNTVGRTIGSGTARQIQLALRFSF